jgi:hypothetical protein
MYTYVQYHNSKSDTCVAWMLHLQDLDQIVGMKKSCDS